MTVRTEVGQKRRTPAIAVVVSSVSLAAIVVLRHLGRKPFWRDEAISISVAARPVVRIIPVLTHHDANAGLYYLVLHAWLRLGGGARGLSALCFTVAVGLAAWAGTRWRGWPVGATCGLLMAVNPFLVYYGQEARPYALAACLAVASTLALFWRRTGPAPRAYVAVTVALLYADLFAVLFVAAVAAAVVVAHRSRSEPVPPLLVRCWAVIGAVSAPLALVMVVGQRGQISWLPRPRVGDLDRTLTGMTGGRLGFWVVVGLAAVAVAAVAAVAGRDRPIVTALAAGALLPPPVLWAAAQIVPCYMDRYVICSAVGFVGVAAAGIDELRRRVGPVVAVGVLAALAIVCAQRTVTMEAGRNKVDDAPAAVAFVTSKATPGDAIAYAGGGLRTVMSAYLPATGPAPWDVALAAGGEAFRQHDLYAREVGAAELAGRLAPVRRLWVVTDRSDHRFPQDGPLARLRPSVTKEFGAALSGSFDAIDVTLYVRNSP